MVIYADILIILNFLVDYFLLKLTAKILNRSPSLIRLILGSLIGAAASLYIFLPSAPFYIEIAVKLILSLIITLSVFGFGGIKRYLRATAVFFLVTFGYAGGMLFLWYIWKPRGMAINNSVVYFNISPAWLIGLSAAFYIIVSLLKYLLSRNVPEGKACKITINLAQNTSTLDALLDTGNSLSDSFGVSEIIIVDSSISNELLHGIEDSVSRYRVIPAKTVSGTTLLEGYRCDSALIECSGSKTKMSKPIIAISKTPLDECKAIINPRSV